MNLRQQVPWLATAGAVSMALASLAPLATVASGGRIPVMDLLSDPAEITGIPWYVGAVSDLNLFVWAAGAAMFMLAGFGLRAVDRGLSRSLLWLGAFTVLLTADDRFLLHEIVFPWLFGLPQTGTMALYAGLLGLILAWHRHTLMRQPEVATLALALSALGTSVALDLIGWDSTARRVAEETAKLFGAVAWSLFPAAIIVRHLHSLNGAHPARTEGQRSEPVPK